MSRMKVFDGSCCQSFSVLICEPHCSIQRIIIRQSHQFVPVNALMLHTSHMLQQSCVVVIYVRYIATESMEVYSQSEDNDQR